MKRLAILTFISLVVFFTVSGFKTIDPRAIEIRDCTLSNDEVNLKIFPCSHYRQSSVSLGVNVTGDNDFNAIGSRRIELLRIPAEGIVFRVPLSKRLASRRKYRVTVDVESLSEGINRLDWQDIAVTGVSSEGFFKKNFKPITEPGDLRDQISAASIRKNLN